MGDYYESDNKESGNKGSDGLSVNELHGTKHGDHKSTGVDNDANTQDISDLGSSIKSRNAMIHELSQPDSLNIRQLDKSTEDACVLPTIDIDNFLNEEGNFERIDKNSDEFITLDEINTAAKSDRFKDRESQTHLKHMKTNYSDIEEESDDEWFDENDGITRADARAHKPFVPDLEFHPLKDSFSKDELVSWASTVTKHLGIQDSKDQKYTNAFRHATTTAFYTLKYGEATAMGLGDLNEFATGIRDRFTDEDDYWKYDSQADVYNNQIGASTATRLRYEATANGQDLEVEDVVKAVLTDMQNGKLITNPKEGKNQFGKTLQKPDI